MPGKGTKKTDDGTARMDAAVDTMKGAKPGAWVAVPTLRGQTWKPAKVGDLLQGSIVASRQVPSKFKKGETQTAYDIRDDEGNMKTVFAKGRLADQLGIVVGAFGFGCDVRITFTGTEKIKGFKNPARRYTVEARRPK